MTDIINAPLAICIVLDRSGSMEDCRTDAIGAVNSYLRQAREDAGMADAVVSLIIFDSDGIDTLRDNVAIASCPDLAPEEYSPRAMTPLLDAVGRGVARLEQAGGEDARRILVIMTDGLENASKEHTKETIAALLKRKQEAGWLIVYLGADHDAWSQAGALGLHAANTASFSKRAMGNVAYALSARSARYASAASTEADLAEGFTGDERAKMEGKK